MATRKTGSRLITVDGTRYRWRIRPRATFLQSDYGVGTLTCTVELDDNPGQFLILRTSHPHPSDWGTACVVPFGPRYVAVWIKRALTLGWAPSGKGRPFSLRAETIPAPTHIPTAVRDLAIALRSGIDCAFALHDALQEAGLIELANHFSVRQHPPGCLMLRLLVADRTSS